MIKKVDLKKIDKIQLQNLVILVLKLYTII
jgi:hypothetical protein